MNIQSKSPVTPLRRRMIEDMVARNLGRHSRRSHLHSCERFARPGQPAKQSRG